MIVGRDAMSFSRRPRPMTTNVYDLHGVKVFALSPDGKKIRTGVDANEVIAEAYAHDPGCVVIPVERLDDAFFELRSGVAGEVISKFVAFRMRVAIVGDIARQIAESSSLRAFVYESNRGNQLWFLASMDELGSRLEASQHHAA